MPATPYSYRQYSSGSSFSVPFPYLLKAHVKVYLGYNLLAGTFTSELVDGVGFTWTSGTQIGTTVPLTTGQVLTVIRQTPSDTRLVDWNDGSKLTADDLDTADLQNLYVVQEQQDRTDLSNDVAVEAKTTALSTVAASNAAVTASNAAVATANAASTTATQASSSASQAVTTANAATTTANQASTSASQAVTTANAADAKADQAVAAVGNALQYTIVANVAAIPASPTSNQAIEVANSTGIESFTPLSGKPAGFVGSSALRVRIIYNAVGSTWSWSQYFVSDPETRYLKLAGGTLTGALTLAGAPTVDLNPASKKYVDDGVTALNSSIGAKLDTTTAASTYLTTSTAASTYQTQAGMSSYQTTAAAVTVGQVLALSIALG